MKKIIGISVLVLAVAALTLYGVSVAQTTPKGDLVFEECFDGPLVGRVEDGAGGAALLNDPVSEAEGRETVVVWDKSTGEPLHPAIVWQDRRTAAVCRKLEAEYGREFIGERTGLTWDPYFSGTKIRWLFEEVDGLAERAGRGEILFGTIDTWLIWKLSNGESHVTDHTNASR